MYKIKCGDLVLSYNAVSSKARQAEEPLPCKQTFARPVLTILVRLKAFSSEISSIRWFLFPSFQLHGFMNYNIAQSKF